MQSWIFQATPKQFDIDGFLATEPQSMSWLAKQRASDMRVGDQVFLWRAIGNGKADLSGIVAEAIITSPPENRAEDLAAVQFWTDPAAAEPANRVGLRLKRIELKRRFKRQWLDNDPVLAKTPILSLRTGTNFILRPEEANRFNALWRRALLPWSYAEVVAALWAYSKTRDGPMSRLPGEPISQVALATGRVVAGVYNKLMNLRAIDPTDQRAGFSQTSQVDVLVWKRFFDPVAAVLRFAEIDAEYRRLWPDAYPIIPPDIAAEERAKAFEKLTLAELLSRYDAGAGKRSARPRTYRTSTATFDRDPLVVAIAQARANGACEVPNCQHPIFLSSDGLPFLEVHHIEPLFLGGPDTPDNVAALCPSHHREVHHGIGGQHINAALSSLRSAP